MKRLRALALLATLLLGLAPGAGAGTWWVSPTGTSGASGVDSTTNATTLGWFNTHCAAGDTCLLKSGTYTNTNIEPRATGTPSQYIVYIGSVADPAGRAVSNIVVDSTLGATRCISIKGVCAINDASFKTDSTYTAGYDSLTYCIVRGQFSINGRDNLTVRYCTIGTGDVSDRLSITANMPVGVVYQTINGVRTPIRNNDRYRHTFVDSLYIADNTFNMACGGSSNTGPAMNLRGVQSSQILRNRFTLRAIGSIYGHLNMWYDCSYNTVNDNYFDGAGDASSTLAEPYYLLDLRDNHVGNSWDRDTLVENSTSAKKLQVNFCTTGNPRDYGLNCPNPDITRTFDFGDSNNTFQHLYVRVRSYIGQKDKSDNNVYLFNVFATEAYVILSRESVSTWPDSNASDSVVFSHNTIYAHDRQALANDAKLTHSIFTSNIIMSRDTTNYPGHFGFARASFQRCDSNLVWSSWAKDSMFAVGLGFLGGAGCKVGSNSTWGRPPYSYDINSKWGDPQLTDSTLTDYTFDARPLPTGLAYSSDWADGYVGAIALAADVTAPAVSITGPTVTRYWAAGESFPLTWTSSDAVGVVSHSIQWANSQNPTEWTSVVSGLSGSTQSYTWTLPGFTSSYATVRVLAYDAAGRVGTATLQFRCDVPPERDTDPYRDGF